MVLTGGVAVVAAAGAVAFRYANPVGAHPIIIGMVYLSLVLALARGCGCRRLSRLPGPMTAASVPVATYRAHRRSGGAGR